MRERDEITCRLFTNGFDILVPRTHTAAVDDYLNKILCIHVLDMYITWDWDCMRSPPPPPPPPLPLLLSLSPQPPQSEPSPMNIKLFLIGCVIVISFACGSIEMGTMQ